MTNSIFSMLGSSGRTLSAFRRGIQLAGNNIANSTNPNYHRQALVFRARYGGVEVSQVQRAYEFRLSSDLLGANGQSASAGAAGGLLGPLEYDLADLGEGGISAKMSAFFAGMREAAAQPGSATARRAAVTAAENLAQRISFAAGRLDAQQLVSDAQVRSDVATFNSTLEEVQSLSSEIRARQQSGEPVHALMDTRQQRLNELAELGGVQVLEAGNGDVSVLMDGVALLQGVAIRRLEVSNDPTTGHAQINAEGGSNPNLTQRITSGRIGGALSVRDSHIPNAMAELDQFAFDLATQVNAVHRSGFGLDGGTGRNLFDEPATVSGAARNFAVNAAVSGDPDLLASASDAASIPGDGRHLQLLADLENATVATGGVTFSSAFGSVASGFGQGLRSVRNTFAEQQERAGVLTTVRDQYSGVSIDEEILTMNQMQYAFEAATKVVQAADEMLQTILAM